MSLGGEPKSNFNQPAEVVDIFAWLFELFPASPHKPLQLSGIGISFVALSGCVLGEGETQLHW